MLLQPVEDRLGPLWRMKLVTGRFTTKPDEVAAVQNDRLGNVWDGTSLNQWSNTPKPRARRAEHRHLLGRVARS